MGRKEQIRSRYGYPMLTERAKELSMKKLLVISAAAGMFSTSSYLAYAEQDPLLAALTEACFRGHAHSMDKPAVKTKEACWRAHAYRMELSQTK